MRKTFCGKFDNSAEFTEKHLVLVECKDPAYIGLMLQEGANSAPHSWEILYEEGDEEFSGLFYA